MKILLITSFFPPLNNIASNRMAAFKKYLETQGCEVDVITRYYSNEQINGGNLLIGYQKASDFYEDYISKDSVYYTNYDLENEKLEFFNKLPKGIKGVYSYLNTDIYQYGWLKYIWKVFEEKLANERYDFIIASHAPAVAFEAAEKISEQYNIPWIADYRDLYIDFKLNPLALALKRYRQHVFLKKASGILFVSRGMKTFFDRFATQKLREIPTEIIYNGFDIEAYSGTYDSKDLNVVQVFEEIKSKVDIVLMHSGSLYKGRNLDFFINAVEDFNNKHIKKVGVILLGLSENNFDQKLSKNCFVLPRVSVNTSFYLQHQADGLLMPIYKDLYTGFSGKVFEYLATNNTVIYDHNPHADLKAFLSNYRNCFEVTNTNEFEKCMFELINKETKVGRSNAPVNEELTRRFQIGVLYDFLIRLREKRRS